MALFPAPALLFLCVSYSVSKLFRRRKLRQVVDENPKPQLSGTEPLPVSPPSSEDTAAAFESLSRSLPRSCALALTGLPVFWARVTQEAATTHRTHGREPSVRAARQTQRSSARSCGGGARGADRM